MNLFVYLFVRLSYSLYIRRLFVFFYVWLCATHFVCLYATGVGGVCVCLEL